MHPLKVALLRGARAAGLFDRVRDSRWRRQRLLILCYHGISIEDEHEWDPELYMPQAVLRERLSHLRAARYNVLPLEKAVHALYEGTLPQRAVAVTFDDGGHDFYERALPVLREFDVPATVYLATYYTDFQHPVFDPACAYIMWKGRERGSCDAAGLAGDASAPPLRVTTHEEREESASRVRQYADSAHLSGMDKELLLRELAARLGVDYDHIRDRRLLYQMSADEVRALPRDLVQVELHTHRHRTPLHAELFAREIRENRQRIAELAGGNGSGRVHFCYPSGYLRAEFLPWLREAGVRTATTCVPGISSAESDPLLLPRLVDTALLSDVAFEAWASGFAALLPRSRASRALAEFDTKRR